MRIENPFPSTCCFSMLENSDNVAGLFPAELEISQPFRSEKRRWDFYTGRRCAHIAMKSAGYQELPILKNEDRSPIWPTSIKGSITHNEQFAAAIIIKPSANLVNVGIDIEDLNRHFSKDITKYILTKNEISKWPSTSSDLCNEAKAIFSIKESIFKCFYPLNKVFLDFLDADVVSLDNEKFQALVYKNPFKQKVKMPFKVEGVFKLLPDTVFTAVQFSNSQLEQLIGKRPQTTLNIQKQF